MDGETDGEVEGETDGEIEGETLGDTDALWLILGETDAL